MTNYRRKLFGTDGVRGEATSESGRGLINPETFFGLAVATVDTLDPARVIVGRDTRPSGSSLASAVIDGALRAGAHVVDLGVVPTPVVGWATGRIEDSIGLVITASHNPARDNGFKVLKGRGEKANPAEQEAIETAYYVQPSDLRPANHPGEHASDPEMRDQYIHEIASKLQGIYGEVPLAGKSFVIDTAYGAASTITQDLLRALGAQVHSADRAYNGRINDGYGANDLTGVSRFVRKHHSLVTSPSFVGVLANDGDGDRVMGLAITESGPEVINGNHMMYFLARGEDGIVALTTPTLG